MFMSVVVMTHIATLSRDRAGGGCPDSARANESVLRDGADEYEARCRPTEDHARAGDAHHERGNAHGSFPHAHVHARAARSGAARCLLPSSRPPPRKAG